LIFWRQAFDKILVFYLFLKIENYLKYLVKGENTKKDDAKVALAQNKSAHDVGHVQSFNQFSVLLESGNQFFGTEPTGTQR
jgi:hypothetical protein